MIVCESALPLIRPFPLRGYSSTGSLVRCHRWLLASIPGTQLAVSASVLARLTIRAVRRKCAKSSMWVLGNLAPVDANQTNRHSLGATGPDVSAQPWAATQLRSTCQFPALASRRSAGDGAASLRIPSSDNYPVCRHSGFRTGAGRDRCLCIDDGLGSWSPKDDYLVVNQLK